MIPFFDHIVVGQNAFGYLVMHCGKCDETFAKQLDGKKLQELVVLAFNHPCTFQITMDLKASAA